jgi:hypothetical protein
MPHTPFQNETLGALADCILEGAPAGHESRAEFLARCSARLHTLPRHRRALMGTALDLLAEGYAVFLAVDAITSRHALDHEIALRRLEAAGTILSTSEAILFEWCRSAEHPQFQKIRRLVT